MISNVAEIIGLRIDPDTEYAEWYTVWYWDEQDETRIATREGRLRWYRAESEARRAADSITPSGYSLDPDIPTVCDIARVLHDIEADEVGNEGSVLVSLNLLDDMLICVECIEDLPNRASLDVFCSHLTMGDPTKVAAENAGGKQMVFNTLYAALGRLFVWSTFEC